MKAINVNKRIDAHLYLLTAILIIFLMVNEYIFFNIAILSGILILILVKSNGRLKFPKTITILLGFIFLILIQALYNPSEYFDQQAAFKEVTRLLIYSLIILIASNISIGTKFFIKLWSTLFLLVLFIAVFQFFKLFGINEILLNFYGESVYFDMAEKYDDLASFRAGSIFINPNGYAKFILCYLAVLLGLNFELFKNKKFYLIILLISVVTALMLAGSRTGFLISMILFLFFVSNYIIHKKIRFTIKSLFITSFTFLIIIISLIIFNTSKIKMSADNFRFLQLEAGIGNSLDYKLRTFIDVVKDFDAHNVLIGLGSFEGVWGVTTIDFDIGYLIAFYGVVGLFLYIAMIYDFYNYRKKSDSDFYMLNKYLIIMFVLFGLTGGIFLNLRTFSFIALLMFTNLVNYDKQTQKNF